MPDVHVEIYFSHTWLCHSHYHKCSLSIRTDCHTETKEIVSLSQTVLAEQKSVRTFHGNINLSSSGLALSFLRLYKKEELRAHLLMHKVKA